MLTGRCAAIEPTDSHVQSRRAMAIDHRPSTIDLRRLAFVVVLFFVVVVIVVVIYPLPLFIFRMMWLVPRMASQVLMAVSGTPQKPWRLLF
jgi:hypothetical protein